MLRGLATLVITLLSRSRALKYWCCILLCRLLPIMFLLKSQMNVHSKMYSLVMPVMCVYAIALHD